MGSFDESRVNRSRGKFAPKSTTEADIDTSAIQHDLPRYADDRDVTQAIDRNVRQRYGGIRGSFSGSYEINYSRVVNKGFRYDKDGTICQKVSDSDLNALIDDNTRFFDDEGQDEERW